MMNPSSVCLFVACALILGATSTNVGPGNGATGNENATRTGNGPAIRHMRPGFLPFPQAVDDLQLFPYQHTLIVTGSKFISVETDNTCWRCEFTEDFNQCVQLNQTLCNATIANGECPASIAGLFCTKITENTAAGPIYVQIRPYKSSRPACYITKGSLRLQPVFDSQIYFLHPTLESCNFAIARYLPPKYIQTPGKSSAPLSQP